MGQRELVDTVQFQDRGTAGLIIPPAGSRGIQAANGALVQVNPDGTTSAIGGGGGGGVATVVGGTGISVNSADPAHPIITNTSALVLVETKTITGSPQTTDLTFSGLDGDTDQHYVLYGRGKNGSAGILELLVQPNGASTNQAGNDVFNGGGASAVIASLTTIRLLQAQAGTFITFEMAIEAKRVTNMARHFDVPRYVSHKSGANFMGWGAYWWDDGGAANLTSLVLKVNQAGQLDVGSYISLYKRTV